MRMIDLVGDPKCKVCYGSGVMPHYHWVEPCMECHPVSKEDEHKGNIFIMAVVVCAVTIGLLKLFVWP